MDIDALPYVPAVHQRRRNQQIDLIVLHSGETNEGSTAAEGMANYFASGNTIGSAHICVDNDSAVRCAPDENRTNGAGGVNENGLHLEQAGRAGQLAEEWADPYSSAVVALAAEVVRAWIAKYPWIRPVFLDAAALARGERDGITTHAQVSQVFAGNDGHWDPGPEYPIDALLDLVRGAVPKSIKRKKVAKMYVLWGQFWDGTTWAFLCGDRSIRTLNGRGIGVHGVPQEALDFLAFADRHETVPLILGDPTDIELARRLHAVDHGPGAVAA